jgi:hypothetical protein
MLKKSTKMTKEELEIFIEDAKGRIKYKVTAF